MNDVHTRRRVLTLTGVGGAASLAGCSGLDSFRDANVGDDPGEADSFADSDGDEELDEEPDIELDEGITAIVEPDEEQAEAMQTELMELQEELMDDVEAGEISEEEAQAEIEERQASLMEEVVAEFESYANDANDLAIEGALLEAGLFLLDAGDEALVDALRDDAVSALLPGEQFEELQQPAPAP